MTRIHDDHSRSIGRTPLVHPRRLTDGATTAAACRQAHRAGNAALPPA